MSVVHHTMEVRKGRNLEQRGRGNDVGGEGEEIHSRSLYEI